MKPYKVVEKNAEILGINFEDFMMWIFGSVMLLALPTIVGITGINLGLWYYFLTLVLIVLLYRFLKKMGQKNYPGYMYSWVAYKFLTPKKITSRIVIKPVKQNKKNGNKSK